VALINQKICVDSIRKYDIVFGIGPAGDVKTYVARAMAARARTLFRDCSTEMAFAGRRHHHFTTWAIPAVAV
jgi:hypothetical protein